MSLYTDIISQIENLARTVGDSLQLRGFKRGGSIGQIPVKGAGGDFDWSWSTVAGLDVSGLVPKTTTVNGHALSANVTVTAGDIGLGNVENTALSTWTGSTNVTTLGTIGTGIWQGTAVGDSYISSAATWNAKQTALVSGTNIKTVAGVSLLGSGDIGAIGDSYISSATTWNAKQAALVSGTNIKTVGGATLIGSGDVGTIGIGYGGTGATTAADARTNLGAQATLVSATNIKTINGNSVLGSGDLTISGATFDNPSAQIGLTAVNGSASTAMRSDAAPAIDQSIAPSWTAAHTFSQSIAAATTATAVDLVNPTAATSGNQRWSPATVWRGKGWKTNATAASQEVAFRAFVAPIQGAANPTGAWTLQSSINGGAWANTLTVSQNVSGGGRVSAGECAFGANSGVGVTSNSLYLGINNQIYWGTTFVAALDNGTFDVNIGRYAANSFRINAVTTTLGPADAASPVSRILNVQSVVAGTSNTAGADRYFDGSQGTGTGAGGAHVFRVATKGTSGTAQNALVEAFRVREDRACFVANVSATPATPSGGGIFYVEAGALKYIGSSGTITTIAPA